MKKLTSMTLHNTSEGQRVSYTYSVIDENSGAVLSENNRESRIILEIPANMEALSCISTLKAYVEGKMTE